jgi:homeobox-leucine zipper protein
MSLSNGGDPNYVALLPSGFAILPNGTQSSWGSNVINDKISSGSLLTVTFQILIDSMPTAKLSLGSVATVNSLISYTVDQIKTALNCENAGLKKAPLVSCFHLLYFYGFS